MTNTNKKVAAYAIYTFGIFTPTLIMGCIYSFGHSAEGLSQNARLVFGAGLVFSVFCGVVASNMLFDIDTD